MPFLYIQLLGDFQLLADDELVPGLHQARLQSCLAYLLRHCQAPHSRRRLAFLFWPNSTEKQAQTNLRKLLHHLRNRLPHAERFLQNDAQTVWWTPDAPFTLDAAEFEQKITQAQSAGERGDGPEKITLLTEAVALYRGEFLRGCYDDWVLAEREALHQQCLGALEQLIAWLEAARDYPTAIRYGHRLLALDPLHEVGYQRLMRLYALHGDRAGALRIYHTCAEQLANELNVEPSVATQELYARLLQQEPPPLHPVRLPQRAGSTRLVGRGAEWRRLQGAWRLATNVATNARPHFVLVAGEAGIGKTRLVEELRDWAVQQGVTTTYARAYAAAGSLAYAPVIDWLGAEPFQRALTQLDAVWRSELARLLPDLLVQDPTLPAPKPLTERWQRQRLFDALTRLIRLTPSPLLLALDDLQWCDVETLEWLQYLLHKLSEQPDRTSTQTHLMVVGTVRAEELDADHPLQPLLLELRRSGQVTEIALGPLDAETSATLAMQAADRTLDRDTVHQIVQASEGSPLFVVEMVRSTTWGAEAGTSAAITHFETHRADSLSLPPKVQAVIQYRLEQLSAPARELAMLAAVIGRSFTFAVLAQASDATEDALVQALDELWQRRIVREQGGDAYDFSHDRIRETTYATISPPRQRQLHRRVAQAMEQIHGVDLDPVSAQLGAHYEKVGEWHAAVTYYRRAANVAAAMNALEQVIFYCEKVLSTLDCLPHTHANGEWRIDTLLQIAWALRALKGYCVVERKAILELAHHWAIQINDQRRQHLLLIELSAYYVTNGSIDPAYQLAREHLALAQHLEDEALLHHSYDQMAYPLMLRGKFIAARHSLAQAMALEAAVTPKQFSSVNIRSLMADTLWLCGYPDQATAVALAAVQLADQQQVPFARIHSRDFMLCIVQRSGDRVTAQHIAEAMLTLCLEFGYPDYMITAQIVQGMLMASTAAAAAGLQQIQRALAHCTEINLGYNVPYYHYVFAQAQLHCGQLAQALETIAGALHIAEAAGDMQWRAELLRFQGELYYRTGQAEVAVEQCYQAALTVARQQQVRMIELRTTVSLARLWQRQGRHAEAHRILTVIYGWFTEGFATADLQAAKALLDELSLQL